MPLFRDDDDDNAEATLVADELGLDATSADERSELHREMFPRGVNVVASSEVDTAGEGEEALRLVTSESDGSLLRRRPLFGFGRGFVDGRELDGREEEFSDKTLLRDRDDRGVRHGDERFWE